MPFSDLLDQLLPALLNLAYGLSKLSLRDYSIALVGICRAGSCSAASGPWPVMGPASARCSVARLMPPPEPCGWWAGRHGALTHL